ncbi:MAG TPA: acyltransferase [Gemmataceae bacterium]|jgi:peptidoglycan/LPS O-acetylase OafA/YrhL|nr:acyltransferase [Gemmataceae bacterium]
MVAPCQKPLVGQQRLRSVDALRGLAALAVLFTHVPHLETLPICGRRLLFLPFDYGRQGVTLFLVISGFCIHLTVAKKLAGGQGVACNWASFWRRRFHRLYPPYLGAIAVSLLCVLAVGWLNPVFVGDWESQTVLGGDVTTHLLLIHNLFKRYTLGLGNGAFWSLGLEEQLYGLYAVFLLARTRLGLARAFLSTLAVSGLWFAFGVALNPSYLRLESWITWPFTWWFVWLLGAVAAEAYAGVIRLPGWCYRAEVACVAACCGLVLYQPMFSLLRADRLLTYLLGGTPGALWSRDPRGAFASLGHYAFAFAFFVAINRAVQAEQSGLWGGRVNHWLSRIGIMSYSLYLVHLPILRVGEEVFGQLHVGRTVFGTVARYILMVPLCVLLAYGFFRLVERRFLNAGTARSVASPLQTVMRKAA